ncbi:hypothetical protein [Amycolatopsis sp. NPDC004079]|uniref:hypothetical protein n=1 Tax=Amycolatopsis sp. NPDC004079 TaxID=3154549 RepID=UPI0033B4961F
MNIVAPGSTPEAQRESIMKAACLVLPGSLRRHRADGAYINYPDVDLAALASFSASFATVKRRAACATKRPPLPLDRPSMLRGGPHTVFPGKINPRMQKAARLGFSPKPSGLFVRPG